MRKTCRLSLLAGVASLCVGAAPAQAGTELPFTSTSTQKECWMGVTTAPPDQCEVTATPSAETGQVAATTRLVSPAGGQAPWSADSLGSAAVVATYQLPEPVPRLDFTVRMHINEASVTLRNLPDEVDRFGRAKAGDLYWGMANRLVVAPVHAAHVTVGAVATAAKCAQGCGATNVWVVGQGEPGTATVSGKDYVLRFPMMAPPGKLIPAGDVAVKAAVNVSARQGSSMGNDSVSVDGVVQEISVD